MISPDETTGALDADHAGNVMALSKNTFSGYTLIIVTSEQDSPNTGARQIILKDAWCHVA